MERFFNKVEKTDYCWNWIAGSRGKGYGAFKYKSKVIDAHRMSWLLHNGKIPNDLFVCHKCDNPSCVNPNHLFLGTHSDNMKDAYVKGRLNTDTIRKPFSKNYIPTNSTLKTKTDIDLVKKAIINRSTSLKQLAIQLNLSYQLIRDISCGRVYK